jgi:hypothetical protein
MVCRQRDIKSVTARHRRAVRFKHTVRYEIFEGDPPGSPRWLEAAEGLEQATDRIEELAANDPSFDYYLYSNQMDKLIRHLRPTSPRPDVRSIHEKSGLSVKKSSE